MAKLGELFGTSSASTAGGATVTPGLEPPPVNKQGVPPGDRRYGAEAPLTDQYAGKTLADLLQDMGTRVDAEKVLASLKAADGGKVFTTTVNNEPVYLQPRGEGAGGAPQPDQLVVLPTAQAKQLLEGKPADTLLGGAARQPAARQPAMPGVNTGGPPLGPPGLGGYGA